jgi:hypothetical protein
MPPDLRSMLNETERALLRETDDLGGLDEDALAALHDRVRRARNKYSKLYRRRAAAQVDADASRSRAHAAHARAAAKAELFEVALAKVSSRLAAEAKAAAAALKKERLDAARKDSPAVSRSARQAPALGPGGGVQPRRTTRTPVSEKTRASTKAATQRRQAARDRRS